MQNQIKYICSQVSQDEWSGSLFYTTTGTFGQDDFECTAHYIFLQDIGTPGYTEYDYDERFTNFMMQNPQFMEMCIGHIHSHNNMAVFFSATDQTEIEDNSFHHNIYLSLIVNNHNDMEAKIAFRADRKSKIEDEYHFKNEKGQPIVLKEKLDEEDHIVLIYNCAIVKPPFPGIDPKFREQFEIIQKAKEEKKKTTTYGYYGGNGSYTTYHSQPKSTPPVDDYDTEVPTRKQGLLYPDNVQVEDGEDIATYNASDYYDHSFTKTILGKKKDFHFDNSDLDKFMKAVISNNHNWEKEIGWSYSTILHTAEKTRREMLAQKKVWREELGKRLYSYYIHYFAEDNGYDFLQEVLEAGLDRMDSMKRTFTSLIDEISLTFKKAEVV